jgi:hypothetical protein
MTKPFIIERRGPSVARHGPKAMKQIRLALAAKGRSFSN